MLHLHKHNLSEAQMDKEKIDTIIDLEKKVTEQEDIYNKCYAECSDLLDLHAKEMIHYNDVLYEYNKKKDYDEKEDHEDPDHDCSYCGKNVNECGEDHGDERREIEYARRRDVWL